MTIQLALAPLVAMIGLLVYALSSNAKPIEIGRLMFSCGLLASLLIWGSSHGLRL